MHIDVTVYDAGYTTIDGQDIRSIINTRIIRAGLDPTRSKELERIFSGSVGDGDIGIYCDKDTLCMDDAYNPDDERKQSFVLYQGGIYRVTNDADWGPQADIRVYLAKRHLDQDGLFDPEDSSI